MLVEIMQLDVIVFRRFVFPPWLFFLAVMGVNMKKQSPFDHHMMDT